MFIQDQPTDWDWDSKSFVSSCKNSYLSLSTQMTAVNADNSIFLRSGITENPTFD